MSETKKMTFEEYVEKGSGKRIRKNNMVLGTNSQARNRRNILIRCISSCLI
jgi:hypothetical protein